MRRVVVTGLGVVSPLGPDLPSTVRGLLEGRSAVRRMEGWESYRGLRSLVAAPAELRDERRIPRTARRSMGRMSLFAAQAALEALGDAGIAPADAADPRIGCAMGSTTGSAISLNAAFETLLPARDLALLPPMLFFQCLSHTVAMNVAQFLGLRGVALATCSACASAAQALVAGLDLVRSGRQDVVLCGGAEELHPTVTASFDVLFATSAGHNERPDATPRPFDRDRDGLVCGEGAGVVVLEERGRAERRGARIRAELLGGHTCTSGSHVSESDRASMAACMRGALADAGLGPEAVDYVSAHATATLQGDREEAEALREVFGARPAVSSLKGHLGHTLGASGAIELAAVLAGAEAGWTFPTRNLAAVADDCGGLDHVVAARRGGPAVVLKNSFAFGGISASLVCRREPPADPAGRTVP